MYLRVLLIPALVLCISIDLGLGAAITNDGNYTIGELHQLDGGLTIEGHSNDGDSEVTVDEDASHYSGGQSSTSRNSSMHHEAHAGSNDDMDDVEAHADDTSQEADIGEPVHFDKLLGSEGMASEEDDNSTSHESATVTDEESTEHVDGDQKTSQENSNSHDNEISGSMNGTDSVEAHADDASTETAIGEPPLDDDSIKESGGVTSQEEGGASNNTSSAGSDDDDTSANGGEVTPPPEAAGEDSDDDSDDEENDTDEGKNTDDGIVGEPTVVGVDANNDSVVARRKKRAAFQQEIILSKAHHPLEVTLILLDNSHRRVKRTSYNRSDMTWPHHIPYIFDSSYKKDNIYQLTKVLEFLGDRLCVDFKHEPDFDVNNKNWFKENGYTTNAYLRFRTKAACSAVYGRGRSDTGRRNISPCNQFFSMMHEAIHSLGGIHAQNYPYRERYITLHKDNIDPRAVHNFKKYPSDSKEVEYELFDPSSLLMYGRGYFTKNGMPTFNYIRSEMAHLSGVTSYYNILFELTKNYKCQENFCEGVDSDCGNGYLGYVHKTCVCVCPPGFDAAERCKKTINSAGPPRTWPDTPFSMYKAEDCPAGTEEGNVPITTKKAPRMSNFKLPYSGKTLNIAMCTKKTPTDNVDYSKWPVGTYCIGKVKDVPCSEPFKEGSFMITTKGTMAPTGEVGDVTVDGTKVTMKFCCQKEGDIRFPMHLPNDKPFRLISKHIYCQKVEGMWAVAGSISLITKAKKGGSAPRTKISRKGFRHVSCYYQPAVYGCSQEITLDPDNPSVSISVPTSGSSREPNRRCFYYFKAPKGDRMRLTIKSMKLHPSDKFLVKRFNMLENPYRINTRDPPNEMITENDELLIEYWSYYVSHWSLKEATFEVDLLPAEKLCYDAATNGADYAGKKEISETYEECVPWADATSCPDFPWDGTNGLRLLNSGKSCRNLDSHGLLQPWCYTSVNGSMCNKRYCDACNEVKAIDYVHDCAKHVKDENFCKTNHGRFSCFKSCNMDIATYDKDQVKCDSPVIPPGLSISGDLQNSYDVGASVSILCNGEATKIECTTLGWTPFDDKCSAQQCMDTSQMCQNALSKFPAFCTNEKSKESAEKYCKKSCGLCEAGSCSIANGASYSLVTPEGDTATTGQDVTFACNGDLHFKSGDLQRACSVSGDLLGEEPVCEAADQPTDINLEQVTEKFKSTPKRKAYLMLGEGLSIPYAGKITRWYAFCKKSKTITFLVYRKTGSAKRYKRVGFNTVTCVPSAAWSYDIPIDKQIAVEKGDILGVHDNGAAVMMQPCGTAKEKPVPVAIAKARKVKSFVKKSTAKFSKKICAYLAIAAHLEPN